MFKIVVISLILSLFLYGCKIFHTQNEENYCKKCLVNLDELDSIEQVCSVVDEMPYFKNNDKLEILNYLIKNVNLENVEMNPVNPEDKIGLEFVVTVKGQLTMIRIKDKDFHQYSSLELEYIRVLKNCPNWQPGLCQSVAVPVRLYLLVKLNWSLSDASSVPKD